jgi:hypothetical protein
MNIASKLGNHSQTDQGTCPGVGLLVYYKSCYTNRGAARCSLHVLGRSAKTEACGRSFAVLSAKVSRAGLRLRHNRLTCGSMLKVSRDASEAVEEQLVSCTAEQSKYCFICTVTLGPCGDLPFTSWGRWQCLRGGADAGLKSYYAACGCGTARTTDAERSAIEETVASTNVANPWATSCAKSPLRAMAPPLNTGLVVPGKLTPLRASSPENAVTFL